MPHCPPQTHHHCHTTSTSVAPLVIPAAAASSASRNTENEELSCDCCCSYCDVLRYFVIFIGMLGCGLDYMFRYNLSSVIVAMVKTTHTQAVNSTSHECPAASNASRDAQTTKGAGEYNWTDQEQGLVLGAFFCGYLITTMIGERVAEMVGPFRTVFLAMDLCAVLTLLTPIVADQSPYALAALRFLMGIVQGPVFPAVYMIMSRWTPLDERATMVSMLYSGKALGAMVSLGFSCFIVEAFGWRSVFYGGGIVTLVWSLIWLVYVWGSPTQHPRISRRELSLLSENQSQPRRKVPWSRIFKSRHLYLLIVMEFSNMWVQGTVITEGPTFLITQIGLDLQSMGLVGFTLTDLGLVMCLCYGYFTEQLKKTEFMQPVNIHRLMQGFGVVITTVSSVGVVLAGCDALLVATFLVMMGLTIPISMVTYKLSPLDIAPNYAGTLSGMCSIGSIAGFLSPMFVFYFRRKESGWTIIFLTNMSVYAVTGLLYCICVSASEEEWNLYEEIPGDEFRTTETRRRN